MVVDTDVDVFPSGALSTVCPVVGHAVAGAVEAAEFLGVEMQQVSGVRVFVAVNGRRRLEGAEAGNPLAAQYPTDTGGGHAEGGGDLGAVQRRRRNATIWMMTGGGNAPRIRCGRELRSRKPSAPSVR